MACDWFFTGHFRMCLDILMKIEHDLIFRVLKNDLIHISQGVVCICVMITFMAIEFDMILSGRGLYRWYALWLPWCLHIHRYGPCTAGCMSDVKTQNAINPIIILFEYYSVYTVRVTFIYSFTDDGQYCIFSFSFCFVHCNDDWCATKITSK